MNFFNCVPYIFEHTSQQSEALASSAFLTRIKGDTMGKYEAILKIAEYGNLTRAAQELGYVQSNLSHMVQRLENELQIKIFHRDRQGVTLTRAGQELVGIMEQIENLENTLVRAALALRTSTLRIGTFSSVSANWVPSILNIFCQRYPETAVFLNEFSTCPEMDAAVRNGEVDCTFYAGTYHSGLDFFPLYRDAYYAVVSRDHPLAQQEKTSIQEISQYPFIMPGEELNCTIKDVLKQMPFLPKVVTKTQEDLSILPLIEHNLGVSILPALSLQNITSNVKTIALEDNLSREVGLLCKPYGEVSDVAKAFIQVTRDFTTAWQVEGTQKAELHLAEVPPPALEELPPFPLAAT